MQSNTRNSPLLLHKSIAKKGFTLAETLLSAALFIVVAGIVGSILVISMKVFAVNAQRVKATLAADGIFDYISGCISCAKDITISSGGAVYPDDDFTTVICISENGRIELIDERGTAAAFGDDFFGGMTAYICFSQPFDEENVLLLEIDVSLDDRLLCERSGAICLMNAAQGLGSADLSGSRVSNQSGDVCIAYNNI
ncbi:MAG: type II secretion system protein J [Oscillospiraceae bacterium]